MSDAAIWVALITALGGLIVALLNNWTLRKRHLSDLADKKENDAIQLRIREIKAVEEFRDTLRETVKEQRETITNLGQELEANRLERLQFEEERLGWFKERRSLVERLAELEALQERVEALESSLGESERREDELVATLRRERDSWDRQRRDFERRIHSLELALMAAGVDVPHEREGTG